MTTLWGFTALIASIFVSHTTAFTFTDRYSCGVCLDVLSAAESGDTAACERYGSCHTLNATISTSACVTACGTVVKPAHSRVETASGMPTDFRVSPGFGKKPYGTLRVSAVTASSGVAPSLTVNGQPATWQYSARFKYKWTDNALHTTIVAPGVNVTVGGATVPVRPFPQSSTGVAGVLIGDPCINDASILSLVACFYGKKFQTATRTPALLNAFVGNQSAMDFWGLLGDNFYDRTGEATKKMFSAISQETKAKPFLTVPGNHDYWVLGAPEVSTVEDQYSNGFMQFYGQDTKAAEAVSPATSGTAAVPFNFSIDPHAGHTLFGGNKPDISNSFFYNQIGNLGVVGFSGAYSLDETRPLMLEACAWLGERAAVGGLEVGMIVGHWDIKGVGASAEMAVPAFYDEMKVLPGCTTLDSKSMLKFFMGHTHCNVPHPHGHVNTGFMVAGQGMEGCGNYGIPVVDTTENRVRVYHFEIASVNGTDRYDSTVGCLTSATSWRDCVHLADTWLDQAIA